MNTNVSTSNRLAYIDNCRALAICFVVFFHNSHLLDFSRDPLMPILQVFTATFIMPIFVIIAGYCGHKSLLKIATFKDLINYNIKNVKRLYVPNVSVAFVMSLLQFEHFSSIISVLGGFWFLTMLFIELLVFSVILYILSLIPALNKNNLIKYLAPPIMFLTVIWVEPFHIGEMIPFFLLGFLLKEANIIETKFSRPSVYILLTLVSIFLFVWLYATGLLENMLGTFYTHTFPFFISQGNIHYWLLRVLLSSSICLAIIALFYRYSKKYTLFSSLGKMTLSIYMFSTIPLFFFQKEAIAVWYKQTAVYDFICSSSFTLYFANSLSFVLTIVFCVLLTKLLSCWKITRIIFLGEK